MQLLTVYEGKQTNETINFSMIECYSCGVPFMVPERLRQNWLKSKESFYCPNGHSQAYTKSTEQTLREQLEAEKSLRIREMAQAAQRLHEEHLARLKAERLRKKSEKELKRVHNGVCPCCNRSFANLERHMKSQHPEVAPSTPANPLQVKISNK